MFNHFHIMYRLIVIFLITVLCIDYLSSQSKVIDSLKCNLTLFKDNDSILIDSYYYLSFYTKENKKKLEYAKLGYEVAIRNSRRDWEAMFLFQQAYPLIKKGDLSKAINILLKSLECYENIGDSVGISVSKFVLAEAYKKNGDIILAKEKYIESISILTAIQDSIRISAAFLNLGELYRDINKFDKALDCFNTSNKIYESLSYEKGIAYTKGNIGLVYTAQNKLDSAEIYLNKSIEILEPMGDNYAVSSYLDGLAEVYFKSKQYNKAQQTAHKSLLLAQEHGLKEQIRDASLRLSTIYDQYKDFEKAFYHQKRYVAYRDSINNEETIRKIANLHTKYEVAQKQKEVDAEKAYKNRYLIIAIGASSVLILLTVLVFIILKISRERRKTNIVLEQQRKDLENANATKNKFFSILSHDLRSPLATFHSYAEVIEICSQHQDLDKLLVLGKELKSSSANMLDLLDNLLQWGVNQMGDHKLTPTTVDLKDVALLEVEHLQHVSNKKNIDVIVSIQPSLTLFVDRVQLSITLRNLLNNAIKFTPAEGTVIIAAEDSKQVTTLKVTDTGVGMTQEQKETLFDFNKINSTYGTQNEKGVGLGMQLVCGFVKENKAKLYVDSELGKGTTFSMVFEKK